MIKITEKRKTNPILKELEEGKVQRTGKKSLNTMTVDDVLLRCISTSDNHTDTHTITDSHSPNNNNNSNSISNSNSNSKMYMDSDKDRDLDWDNTTTVSYDELVYFSKHYLTPSLLNDIIIERNVNRVCAYILCDKPILVIYTSLTLFSLLSFSPFTLFTPTMLCL
jgi:hypothetical protein